MTRITHDHRYMHRNVSWKTPVRAATTASITIATALNNGDTLDGVTLATGDRVLVKDQSTGAQNGIYVVGVTPVRADDFALEGDVLGMVVIASEGTVNADTAWLCTTNAPIVVGTTTLVFTAFGTGGGGGSTITVEQTGGTPSTGSVDTVQVGSYTNSGGGVVILFPEITGIGVAGQLQFASGDVSLFSPDGDAYVILEDASTVHMRGRGPAGDLTNASYILTVGEDDLVLYVQEKDATTVQFYADQNVELTDVAGALFKTRDSVTSETTSFANLHWLKHGTADPSAGAGVASTIGSFYGRNNGGVGELWLKTGAADTAWAKQTVLGGSAQTYTESNVTTDRAFNANSTTLDEIADVLGTLIGDLRNRGIVA